MKLLHRRPPCHQRMIVELLMTKIGHAQKQHAWSSLAFLDPHRISHEYSKAGFVDFQDFLWNVRHSSFGGPMNDQRIPKGVPWPLMAIN